MVAFRTYNSEAAAVFHRVRDTFGAFSNMATGLPYWLGRVAIPSSEHHYQAARYPDHPEIQEQILEISSPLLAKRKAYETLELTRKDWDDVKVPIMKHSLRLRFAFNRSRLLDLYESTLDMPIVELSIRDDYWGAKPGQGGLLLGRNVLGRLHMGLRQEIRLDPSVYLTDVPSPSVPHYRLLGREVEPMTIIDCGAIQCQQGSLNL